MLSLDFDIYSLHLWFNNDETASLVLPTWAIALVIGLVVFRKKWANRK